MSYLKECQNSSVLLSLYIQPKAAKNKICGLHGEELKLAITAPPVDGKANKMVTSYLAKLFGVTKSSVTIKSGQQSRHKQCVIEGVAKETAQNILQAALNS